MPITPRVPASARLSSRLALAAMLAVVLAPAAVFIACGDPPADVNYPLATDSYCERSAAVKANVLADGGVEVSVNPVDCEGWAHEKGHAQRAAERALKNARDHAAGTAALRTRLKKAAAVAAAKTDQEFAVSCAVDHRDASGKRVPCPDAHFGADLEAARAAADAKLDEQLRKTKAEVEKIRDDARFPHGSKLMRMAGHGEKGLTVLSGAAIMAKARELGYQPLLIQCDQLPDGLRCPCSHAEECVDDPDRPKPLEAAFDASVEELCKQGLVPGSAERAQGCPK